DQSGAAGGFKNDGAMATSSSVADQASPEQQQRRQQFLSSNSVMLKLRRRLTRIPSTASPSSRSNRTSIPAMKAKAGKPMSHSVESAGFPWKLE
ncbi:MAG: hypothetical protein M1812_008374, partial [Candelaria pacifica]